MYQSQQALKGWIYVLGNFENIGIYNVPYIYFLGLELSSIRGNVMVVDMEVSRKQEDDSTKVLVKKTTQCNNNIRYDNF